MTNNTCEASGSAIIREPNFRCSVETPQESDLFGVDREHYTLPPVRIQQQIMETQSQENE